MLTEYQNINDVAQQKLLVAAMLSSSSDDDGYEQCFKVLDNQFLCRIGLSHVLQLSQRKVKKIIPSQKIISQRYCINCISAIFSALVNYRSYVLQSPPSRNNHMTYVKSVKWSLPCFAEAVKKVNRLPAYNGKHGISTLVSHLGITAAINNEQIILGAIGNQPLESFVRSVHGYVIDLKSNPGYNSAQEKLYNIIKNISPSHWHRVNKISLLHANGSPIEYTSLINRRINHVMG
jgi:hypothetical protein